MYKKRRKSKYTREIPQHPKGRSRSNKRKAKLIMLPEIKQLNLNLRNKKRVSRELIWSAERNSQEHMKEAREEITKLPEHIDELLKGAEEQREETGCQ